MFFYSLFYQKNLGETLWDFHNQLYLNLHALHNSFPTLLLDEVCHFDIQGSSNFWAFLPLTIISKRVQFLQRNVFDEYNKLENRKNLGEMPWNSHNQYLNLHPLS